MVTITLSYSTITEQVKRSLSIIAKRSVDDNGVPLFKDITLGSREEIIINDFFSQAITELCTQMEEFFVSQTTTSSAGTVTSVDLSIDNPSNWNSGLLPSLEMALTNYLVSYALHSWFVVTAPRLVDKYLDDQKRMFAAVHKLLYSKKEPTPSTDSYADITGEVVPPEPEPEPQEREDITMTYGDGTTPSSFAVGDSITVVAQTEPEGLPVTYSSSNEEVATVGPLGVITGVSAGNAVITASFAGDSQYNPCSATLNVNIIGFTPGPVPGLES